MRYPRRVSALAGLHAGLCGPVYIAGMAELVLLSREYDRFPYAPPPLKSDPGDARTVAPPHSSARRRCGRCL